LRVRPFREAFVGYHYLPAALACVLYVLVSYKTDHRLLAGLDPHTRGDLYLSLTATTGVLLGFAITAVAVFTSLGDGAGLELLSTQDDFAYARTILMGAIYALAVALIGATAMILVDEEPLGNRWVEAIGLGLVTLALLRTWALLWLLDKLLTLAIADRKRRASA
jgi:hypothetical protein